MEAIAASGRAGKLVAVGHEMMEPTTVFRAFLAEVPRACQPARALGLRRQMAAWLADYVDQITCPGLSAYPN